MLSLLEAIWSVTLELAPWLVLGTVVSGIIHAWMPCGWVERHLRGRVGVVKAVLFGIPLPLCSCGVIPAGLGLHQSGASKGASVGFLISTPQTGVDSTLVAAGFLGWPFALFKLGAAAVTGVVGGLLTDRLDPTFAKPTRGPAQDNRPQKRLTAMWQHGIDLLRTIWVWLVIGVVLSAAINLWVPDSWIAGVERQGTLVALLGTLALSLPLYVCATASVPIAAALVSSGLPAGAALVFLMAGPATNLATLGAIYRALGARTLIVYLTTLIAASVGLGYGFEFVLPAQLPPGLHEHGEPWYAYAAAAALVPLIAWFAWQELRARASSLAVGLHNFQLRNASQPASTTESVELELPVSGMTCGNCASKLQRKLQAQPGVHTAQVQLEPGLARIRSTLSANQLRGVIEQAGFSVPANAAGRTPKETTRALSSADT